MAPPKRPWFRFYVEAFGDPKLRRLSPEERWLWVAVLGAARRSPMPGHLMLTESLPMEADDLAELAGMTPARVEKGLAKMVSLGIVTYHNDNGWRVPKWDERQFESDTSTERAKKHRSRVDAPTMQRPNGHDEAPPETEAESETDPSTSPVTASPDDDEVWIQFARLKADASPVEVGQFERWSVPVIADGKAQHVGKLDNARAQWPHATAGQLARYLFDGTRPPRPPKLHTCSDCGASGMTLAEYEDHPERCGQEVRV